MFGPIFPAIITLSSISNFALARSMVITLLFLWQLKHHLQWEGNIRDLNVLGKTTSFDVRKEAGLSLKSAFKHILSVDLRNDNIFPTSGSLFQMTSEIAGAGGNVGYLKNDFYLQGNYSILEDFVSITCSRNIYSILYLYIYLW